MAAAWLSTDNGGSMTNVEVHGFAEPGYGRVADAFAANFENGEVGAAVAVEVGGTRVVDLNNWFGTDPDTRASSLVDALRASLG
jgi:CubicO group peptidase (beta-lactamase class C family)